MSEPNARHALMRESAIVAVAVIALAGCGVRRPYIEPIPLAPGAWTAPLPPAVQGAAVDAERLSRWWESFGDPQLTTLTERAVASNLDVRTAVSRVREARATVISTRSTRLPSVDLSPSFSASRSSSELIEGDFGGGDGDRDSAGSSVRQTYGVGLDASWELDVFGGIASSIDSAAATAQAREADLHDVLVSLLAEVALDYVDIRSLQRRLEIAQRNLATQEEALTLTRFRLQAGLTTELDVQQALSNVESTHAQISTLDAQISQAIHALAVLLGEPPAALNGELMTPTPVPQAPAVVAFGIPAEALRRRPDIRSAERQLAAQFEQVNAARADLYPTFRLAGSIGFEALSLARMFLPGAASWSVRPSASWRVFDRAQLKQSVIIQSERQQQAVINYESRVLGALQEVEDALTAYAHEQVRRDHLSRAAAAARSSSDLALQLYTSGLRDFRDVLDAQRSALSLEDSLASSEASVSSDLVRVYKAVGGGWAAIVGIEDGNVPPAP